MTCRDCRSETCQKMEASTAFLAVNIFHADYDRLKEAFLAAQAACDALSEARLADSPSAKQAARIRALEAEVAELRRRLR